MRLEDEREYPLVYIFTFLETSPNLDFSFSITVTREEATGWKKKGGGRGLNWIGGGEVDVHVDTRSIRTT